MPAMSRRSFIGAASATALTSVGMRSLQAAEATTPMKLPLRSIGLDHIPAVPIDLEGMADTIVKLGIRAKQTEQAIQGLSRTFTIGGSTGPALEFLFASDATNAPQASPAASAQQPEISAQSLEALTPDLLLELLEAQDADRSRERPGAPLASLPLDDPAQWSISWTTMPDVNALGAPHLDAWAASVDVDSPDKATDAFFPTIASYGLAYNLILPKKVTSADLDAWRDVFGAAWTPALDEAANRGLLYVIDLRIFENLRPQTVAGSTRFTPGTVTVLTQDATTKSLTPELVRVAGGGSDPKLFSRADATPAGWLYALQAAKVSVTVYGIWLGHVYHWHIVTAAMQMTMFATLEATHPVRTLLEPQSSYLIPFDDVLLVSWDAAAPPTSIASGLQFLQLMDRFAEDREFSDDDPTTALEQLGLSASDFTVDEPWDRYPIVGHLLEIWEATGAYVSAYIDQVYGTDQDVQGDQQLQAWIAASADADGGNVRGLPPMESRDDLKRMLHSLIYRITAHGAGRLYRTANPALTFVANFPPCLQESSIPDPTDSFDTPTLLGYLPNTGSIGSMVHFYFTFTFSTPYVPFVPITGPETGLFFDDDPSNDALIELRRFIIDFIERFQPDTPQIWQWPLNIET